jgi:hypothetical protein
MTPEDAQPYRCSPICITSSTPNSARPISIDSGGQTVRGNVLAARATTLATGACTNLLCLSYSSRRIARELGGYVCTRYLWCWWLRNAALSYAMERQLEGMIEADEFCHIILSG